jgi:hypothetical protein
MKKYLIVFFALLMSALPVLADRIIPDNLIFVQIREVDMQKREIKLLNARDGFITRAYRTPFVYEISNAIKIRDENNRFITRSNLPKFEKRVVGARFHGSSKLIEVWVLSEKETTKLAQKIKEQDWDGEIRPKKEAN